MVKLRIRVRRTSSISFSRRLCTVAIIALAWRTIHQPITLTHLGNGWIARKEVEGGSSGDGLSLSAPTGIGSAWEYLPDNLLEKYFTPAEIGGLKTKQCGDARDINNPWRWQGQIDNRTDNKGGPCCPNGHIYGWNYGNLQDRSSLRKVEVMSNGVMMPPFQIRSLMESLIELRGWKQEHVIWIYGDSTQRQLFYGFLCGFVRAGGKVVSCHNGDKSAHYSHPLCKRDTSLMSGFVEAKIQFELKTTTGTNKVRTFAVAITKKHFAWVAEWCHKMLRNFENSF